VQGRAEYRELSENIRQAYLESRGVYGARKIHRELVAKSGLLSTCFTRSRYGSERPIWLTRDENGAPNRKPG
jgi:hypothetical protein